MLALVAELFLSGRVADHMKDTSAPYPQDMRSINRFCNCQVDEVVEDSPVEACLKAVVQVEIGRWLGCFRIHVDPQCMIRRQGIYGFHQGLEPNGLFSAFTFYLQIDNYMCNIVDPYRCDFHRRDQPMVSGVVAPKYRRKHLHQFFT